MPKYVSKINNGIEDLNIKDNEARSLINDLANTLDPFNGHDYVEIGGLKWATMNVGANSITDTGLYFQWGDTQGYTADQVGSGSGQKYFGWADYKYGNGTSSPGATGMTKYNSTDGLTTLEISDDAARANMGGSWRMPTTTELQALGAAVNAVWTSDYNGSGVAGLVCTDKTDNSKTLFFPTAGYCGDGSVYLVGSNSNYWSSSLYSSNVSRARYFLFGSSYVVWDYNLSRSFGFPVRGVCDANSLIDNKIGKIVDTTWSDLKTLRDNSNLVPGLWYRITDYVTTTIQEETQSAGHQFDIIVTADANNKLNENAYAALHSGDTYFENSKLEAWELKYCLDNDTNRFAWANTANGKGVIYWMKDEFFNECGYDFKNIMFARYKITAMAKVPSLVNTYSGFRAVVISGQGSLYPSGAIVDSSDKVYRYTFNLNGDDYSLTPRQNGCHENVIAPYKPGDSQANRERQFLNNITFANTSTSAECTGNKFKSRCHSMVFGNNCYSNTFGNDCYYNTFDNRCYNNTFDNSCYSNTFGGYCYYNTFGNRCYNNTFGVDDQSNIFGNDCYYNTFDSRCVGNTFGNDCYYNTFGNYCNYNIFGGYCNYNTFSTITKLIFGNNNQVLFGNDDIYQKKDGVFYPVSHPDLSTQPSILPQRFGNKTIKEVLIANGRESEIPENAMVIEAWSFNNIQCTPSFVEYSNIPRSDAFVYSNIPVPTYAEFSLSLYPQSLSFDNVDLSKFSVLVYHSGQKSIIMPEETNIGVKFWINNPNYPEITIDINQAGSNFILYKNMAGPGAQQSDVILEDVFYDGVSIFFDIKTWQITNSNNVTPDFTLVKYIVPEGGGYYGGY